MALVSSPSAALLTLFCFLFLRYTTPFNVFMTPYLLEQKHITHNEVFSNITPLFFLSSLLVSPCCPFILKILGGRNVLLLETFMELIAFYILLKMPKRSLKLACLAGCLHGSVTAIESCCKSYLLQFAAPDVAFKYQYALKRTNAVGSAWVGQDLRNASGSHVPGLLVSAFCLLSALPTGFLLPETNTNEGVKKKTEDDLDDRESDGEDSDSDDTKYKKAQIKKKLELKKYFESLTIQEQIRYSFQGRVLFYSLLHVIASTSYICFAMFSVAVFAEKKKGTNLKNTQIGRVAQLMNTPIRSITNNILYVLKVLGLSFQNEEKENQQTLFGYVDGLAKIFAIFCSSTIPSLIRDVPLIPKTVCGTIFVLLSTLAMSVCKTLFQAYCVFIFGSVSAQMSLIFAKSGLSSKEECLDVVFSGNLVVGSFIHIAISYLGKFIGMRTSRKMVCYFWINYAFLAAAAYMLIKCDLSV